MQGETEGHMKFRSSRALKRSPSGQPLDHQIQTRSRGWPERDFGVIVQLCHEGAHFEALEALTFIATSVSPCIFLGP